MINKITTFKERFNEAIELSGKRPVDVAKQCQISESTISQYRSGYAEPKADRLAIIAQCLQVDPAWLMGIDTDRDIKHSAALTSEEVNLLSSFRNSDLHTKETVLRILEYAERIAHAEKEVH